jgi:hypothetical protein
MNTITLLRTIAESIEICQSYEIIEDLKNVEIYFYHAEPVDRVKWVIRADFYKKHIKSFVDTASSKRIMP